MNTTTHDLQQLGLRDYEAKIYTALLEHSPANATHIAKVCNLSRSSVYTVLTALGAKGLVGTTYKNNVKQFVVEDIDALEQMLLSEKRIADERLKKFSELRKQLTDKKQQEKNIPQILFFEGQGGLKKIYLSMMRKAAPNTTLLLIRDEFVWQQEWSFIFESPWHDRIKKIKTEKNITTKLLINKSPTEKKHLPLYQSKKKLLFNFLPQASPINQFALYILDDMCSILSIEQGNLAGVHITNQRIADNFKALFEGLWNDSQQTQG